MRARIVFAGILLLLPACMQTADEHWRELAKDGQQLYRQGSYAGARESFRTALSMHPDDADLHYQLALCHERLGNKADAAHSYTDCLQRAPSHADARHALLVLTVENGQQAEGKRMAQEWLKSRPDQSGAYVACGWLCAREGDVDSAPRSFPTRPRPRSAATGAPWVSWDESTKSWDGAIGRLCFTNAR